MSITLNFELNDRDLAHFEAAMERSRKAAEGRSDADIINCAVGLLDDAHRRCTFRISSRIACCAWTT